MRSAANYPNLSELFAEKMKARRARAALSVGEKLEALDRLKQEAATLRKTRLERAASKTSQAQGNA